MGAQLGCPARRLMAALAMLLVLGLSPTVSAIPGTVTAAATTDAQASSPSSLHARDTAAAAALLAPRTSPYPPWSHAAHVQRVHAEQARRLAAHRDIQQAVLHLTQPDPASGAAPCWQDAQRLAVHNVVGSVAFSRDVGFALGRIYDHAALSGLSALALLDVTARDAKRQQITGQLSHAVQDHLVRTLATHPAFAKDGPRPLAAAAHRPIPLSRSGAASAMTHASVFHIIAHAYVTSAYAGPPPSKTDLMRLAAVPSSASLSSLSSVAPSTPSGRSSSGPVSWSVRPSLRLATPAPSSRAHRRLARRDDSASALIKNLLLEPNPKALFSRIAPYVNMGATMDKDVAKLPAEERGMRVFPTMDEMHVKQVIDRLRDLKLTRHTGPDADLINYIDTSAWSDFQAQVANNDFNWMTKEYAPFFLSSKEEPLWLAMTSRQRKTIPNKEAYGPFCRTLQHHDELRKEFLEFFPEHAQDYMGREIELNALKYSQAMAQEALHFVDHASERTQKRLVAKELKEEFENLMKKFFKGSFESIDTMTRPIYSIPANGADGDFWNARTLARRIEALFAHAEPGELLFKYTQLPTATTPDFIAFLCTETGLPVPKEEFLLSQKEASNAIARAALAVHKAVPTVCTNVPKLAQHRGLFLNMTKALQERIEAFTLPVVPFAEKRMSDMAFMETLAMRTAPNQSMILLLTVFFVTAVVISIIMVHGHYPVHQETGE